MWQHLLSTDTTFVGKLRAALEADGFSAYDPFPGGMGSPVGKLVRVRLFVTPLQTEWQKIMVAPRDTLPEKMLASLDAAVLDIQLLSLDDYQITAYPSGATTQASLEGFLRDDATLEDIQKAAQMVVGTSAEAKPDLPPELQQFAQEQGVEAKHVNKLMKRVSRQVFRKMGSGGDDEQTAKATLAAAPQGVDWSSPSAQRLLAVMRLLTVPDDWHRPDWKTLTAAYQVARQQQRGDALLLPGDKTALEQIPDVLDYTPLYYSKRLI